MTKPITPKEARAGREASIPPQVFEAFNKLILKNLSGGTARVMQSEAIEAIMYTFGIPKERRGELFDKHYLDVEDHYRRAGWNVKYDKPGYNEEYEASFLFSEKKP